MSGAADREQRWETIAAAARTLVGSPDSTLKPRRAELVTGERSALVRLAGVEPETGIERRVSMGTTLGQGGMGIVRVGMQRSLERQVAVKGLRDGRKDQANAMKLLQEAWITGRLEHPNIVPVYDVGLDETSSPLIVLKRIEGQAWSDLIESREVAADDGAADLLEWNLRVLMQVCNAVSFAHSRGVVHLDLKPENVMLGAFGEVYVVDWGIAMSLDDRDDGLPRAADNTDIVGTPSYMAPEMLDPEARPITAATDIYLLGAILYEIMTGHPPHQGETLMEVLHAVATRTPVLDEHHAPELARICLRALDQDPARRFPTVLSFRRALEAFLRHRDSETLADEALGQLADLRTLCAEAAGDPADTRADRHATFAAARFGFRQALASWPENERASQGLRGAAELLIGFELDHGAPESVAAVAAEVPGLDQAIRDRLDAALLDKRARLEALEQLGRDADLGTGTRTRAFLAGVLGLMWAAAPLAAQYAFTHGGQERWRDTILLPVAFLVIALGLGYWARESMTKTRINRQVAAMVVLMLVDQVVLMAGAYLLGLPIGAAIILLLFLWFVTACFMVLAIDRRAVPLALGYLVGFLLAAAHPEWRYWVIAACNTTFLVNVLVIWTPWGNVRGRASRS